jgi:hypothetical protein
MGFWILPTLGISLVLTIVLELIFAFIAGIRNKKDFMLVTLVNILTNPPVVLAYYLFTYYTMWNKVVVIIPLEILAILVEAYYYKSYGKNFRHPLVFSLFANAISLCIGTMISLLL